MTTEQRFYETSGARGADPRGRRRAFSPGALMIGNISNPEHVAPAWWDQTWEAEWEPESRFGAPIPGTVLPCGCHLRRPDCEAVLCAEHLTELNAPSTDRNAER